MTIEELKQSEEYELIAEHSIDTVKIFLLENATKRTKLMMLYSLSVLVSIATVSATLGYELVTGDVFRWFVAFAIGIVAIPIYIVLHEVIHYLGFKMMGVKKVYIKSKFEKFLFYTIAPNNVFRMRDLKMVVLMPLVSLGILFIVAGAVLPTYFVTMMTLFSFHLMACSGDILILNFMSFSENENVITYDDEEGNSYYYRRK